MNQSKLLEGGNVFKGADKQPLTQRIATADVESTVDYIEKITGLDFTKEKDLDDKKPVKWLGTTGRKEDPDGTFERNSSGDLDLSVDANEVDKRAFADKLIAQFGKENIKLSGDNVHWKVPINGDSGNGFVQADFMFSANPKFQQGSMISGGGEYRGEHRHIILSSIARAKNMKYSPKHGILNPQTDELLPCRQAAPNTAHCHCRCRKHSGLHRKDHRPGLYQRERSRRQEASEMARHHWTQRRSRWHI